MNRLNRLSYSFGTIKRFDRVFPPPTGNESLASEAAVAS